MKKLILVTIFLIQSAGLIYAGNIEGKVEAKNPKNIENAIIYIEAIEGKVFAPPKESALMDQKNLAFHPHVLPILTGSTVEFLNSDDVLHNVFSPDKCSDKFNLGSWPKGEKKEYKFSEPGCNSVVLCNVHPEMEAYILVVETPYYAVSNKDGKFAIKDVPAGDYTLSIWHERLEGESQDIKVPAKSSLTVQFKLTR